MRSEALEVDRLEISGKIGRATWEIESCVCTLRFLRKTRLIELLS